MLRRLKVALVFNLKKDNEDGASLPERDVSTDRGDGKQVAVASHDQALETRTDIYAEWDTKETIEAVRSALSERHDVTLIEADESSFERLRALRPEIAFNIAEGFFGVSREAQMPAIFEMLGIPYTGSDPVTLGITLDKARTKEILSYHSISTPPFAVVEHLDQLSSLPPLFPAIVKPIHEGSSKGIFDSSVVRSSGELRAQVERVLFEYQQPALVEKFLTGREFTVAVFGNNEDLEVLPIVEMRFDSLPEGVNPIYSYEAKWIWDQIEHPIDVHECPARIDDDLRKRIENLCRATYSVLRCRDWSRIDVRLDEEGKPHILEINPLPGILPDPQDHSCFPLAARTAGYSYSDMLNHVLELAARRYSIS